MSSYFKRLLELAQNNPKNGSLYSLTFNNCQVTRRSLDFYYENFKDFKRIEIFNYFIRPGMV